MTTSNLPLPHIPSLYDQPKLKSLPLREQPAYRVSQNAAACNLTELLAAVIGGQRQIEIAEALLARFDGDIRRLYAAHPTELSTVKGISQATAARIKAALNLGLRLNLPNEERPMINSPADAAALVQYEMSLLEKEHLRVFLLDRRNRVLDIEEIYQGSVNSSQVRVGEIFHAAIGRLASAIIIVHNHPSGDPTPSPDVCHKPLYLENPMPINETYRTWKARICELRPRQRITQVQNIVWLLVGIYHSHSVNLSRIAGKVIGAAKNVSTVRRLSRFLANLAVDVRSWYKPIAKAWLRSQFERVGEVRLILDGTKIGFAHQLLMVSLAYRRRAVPIAWCWVKYVRGHSTGKQQISLLKHVKILLPKGSPVFVVSDSEFGSILVLRQLEEWHWFYVLRQKGNTGLWRLAANGWSPAACW